MIWDLCRAQNKWAQLSQVIGQDGYNELMVVMFYIAVVRVLLLYGL